MPAELKLEWDSRDLQVWRGKAVEKALVRAVSKAGGDAIRALQIGSSRLVRERKRFAAARVKRALPIFFPSNKSSLGGLVWRMDVSGEPMRVADLPHSQTARGVSVAINRGSRKLIRGAFIATLKSGHEGVFKRRGKGRLPIDEAFTSRVSDVVQDRGFIPFVQLGAQAKFAASFERLLPLELEKLTKRT